MEMPCCHVGASEGALKLTLVALANAAAAPASMKDLRVTKVASLSSLLLAASQAGQARCQEWQAAPLSSANGVRAPCPLGQLELTARGLPVFRRGSLHVAGRSAIRTGTNRCLRRDLSRPAPGPSRARRSQR